MRVSKGDACVERVVESARPNAAQGRAGWRSQRAAMGIASVPPTRHRGPQAA
jgi:hypothetical protein